VVLTDVAKAEIDVEVVDEMGNPTITTVLVKNSHPVDSSHMHDTDNICLMNNMHEAPLLDLLRRRFNTRQIYTFTGNVLISINPYVIVPGLYDQALRYLTVQRKVDSAEADIGGGADFKLAPHVYSVANRALSCMISSPQPSNVRDGEVTEDQEGNQSVVISGESGAGKTENSKYVMSFLIQANKALTAASPGRHKGSVANGATGKFTESLLSVLLESSVVLEAFGNAKTVRNDNSSRFGKYIKLMYSRPSGPDGLPELVAAVTDTFLLEKSRLVSVGRDERNYHVFYQLVRGLAAVDGQLWQDLSLHLPVAQYATLVQGGCSVITTEAEDAAEFSATLAALRTLHCSEGEITEVWRLLACLLHLSSLECVDANTVGGTNDEPARITASTIDIAVLASHLGFEVTELLRCLTTQELMIMKRSSLHIKVLSSADVTRNILALVKWMYDRLFAWLVRKINTAHANLSHNGSAQDHGRFIGILDIFGFEILGVNSFEQLCINLTNERLQQQFNETVFVSEQEMYRAEGLQWNNITFRDNQHVIDLIAGTRAPLGLLLICEEHCMLNRGVPDDIALLGSFDQTHEPIGAAAKAASAYSKPRFKTRGFVVRHFAGEVTYAVDGFLAKNNDAMQEDLLTLLKASSNVFLRNALNIGESVPSGPGYIYTTDLRSDSSEQRPESPSAMMGSPAVGEAGSRTSKRIVAPKKHAASLTVSQQFRTQLDALMKTLRRTQPHYIKCVKPNTAKAAKAFEAPLVMEQLRYSGVLEVVRIRREGFPIRLTFLDFYRRYQIFARGKSADQFPGPDACRDEAQARWCCAQIAAMVMHAGQYQLGHTLIFLRDDGLEVLAGAIREYLSSKATLLQATYRAHRQHGLYRTALAHVVLCQALVRRFIWRRKFRRARKAVVCMQWALLRLVSRRRFLHIRELKRYCAIRIQAVVRGKLGRGQLYLRRAAAEYIQLFVSSRHRTAVARKRFLLIKFAVLRLQLFVRQAQHRTQQGYRALAAVKIQSIVRMRRDRFNFILAKFAAMRIQAVARGQAARLMFFTAMLKLLRLQEFWRSALARKRRARHELTARHRAAVLIQKSMRARQCRRRYEMTIVAAVISQSLVRRFLTRRQYVAARHSAVAIQRVARGRQARMQYTFALFSVVVVQSFIRRVVAVLAVQRRLQARERVLSVLHMWFARRRYLMTVWNIVLVQSVVRRKMARLRYEEAQIATVVLQSFARMVLAQKHRAFTYVAVIVVQSVARMFLAREQYKLRRFCVIKMQSVVRMRLQMTQYSLHRYMIVVMQTWVRGVLATLAYRKAIGSAILLETHCRAFLARRDYRYQRSCLFALQRAARAFVAHLQFKQEITHFHEMLMGEDPESHEEGAGVRSRQEVKRALQTALRRRPTLSLIRNMWAEYCTAVHSAVLGGDPSMLSLLQPNYRDLFAVDIRGRSSAHYLAERPGPAILRAVCALLDGYVYSSSTALRGLDADDDDDGGWFNKGNRESTSTRISVSLKQTINNSVGKDTLKQGWLKKKRGGVMWQRRYMVLTEDYIIYYKSDQTMNQPKFAIPLEELSVHRLPGNRELVFEITSPNMPDKKTMFGSSNKKSMAFMADSEQDLQEWILPLKAIAGVEETQRPAGSPIDYANMVVRQLWATQRDRRGSTALHLLASSIHGYRPQGEAAETRVGDAVQLAAWLIEHGCDVNAQNDAGHTALHVLVYEYSPSMALTVGSRELMRCLILKGADGSRVRDNSGSTALDAINSSKQLGKGLKRFLADLFKIRSDTGSGQGKPAASQQNKLKGYTYLSLYLGDVALPSER
jgi:hypothetical protein